MSNNNNIIINKTCIQLYYIQISYLVFSLFQHSIGMTLPRCYIKQVAKIKFQVLIFHYDL